MITLQLVINLLLRTVMTKEEESLLKDVHLAAVEGAREENILLLQSYYKYDEMFLEVFEDEYLDLSANKELSVEHLLMDSRLLLPPAGSPLTGISFDRRLPCGEVRIVEFISCKLINENKLVINVNDFKKYSV